MVDNAPRAECHASHTGRVSWEVTDSKSGPSVLRRRPMPAEFVGPHCYPWSPIAAGASGRSEDLILQRVSLQLGWVVLVEGEAVHLDGQQRMVGHPVVDDEIDRRSMPHEGLLPYGLGSYRLGWGCVDVTQDRLVQRVKRRLTERLARPGFVVSDSWATLRKLSQPVAAGHPGARPAGPATTGPVRPAGTTLHPATPTPTTVGRSSRSTLQSASHTGC